MRLAPETCWLESSCTISSSDTPVRSGQRMIPREVFKVPCGEHFAGVWKNCLIFKRFSACLYFSTSTNNEPDDSFSTEFGGPAIDTKTF